MAKKNTKLRDQRRRREIKRAKKRDDIKRLKAKKSKIEKAMDFAGASMSPAPQQKSVKLTIYTLWRDSMLLLGKVKCKIGVHDWKLCSGRPGDSKYVCLRCWKRSNAKWREGSSSYYKNRTQYAKKEEEEKTKS